MEQKLSEKIDFELAMFTNKTPSMDLIIDNLYIGNYPAALSIDLLKTTGITSILLAGKDMECMFPDSFTYKVIPLYDSPNTNITKYFGEANKFIKENIEEGKVLVHCGAGVSRSVSLVLAYLISEHGMPYSDALALVKSKRKCANPNNGFEKHLRNYSYDLNKKF
jgi:hypothetical protein